MRVELHPEVGSEIRSAALWYEEQRQGLGDAFVPAVAEVLDRIENAPQAFPRWPGTTSAALVIRKAVLSRFPYLIAFEHYADHVLVLGVVHSKRRPLYWLRRGVGGHP
ncbi:MAG TPA: hypothetical protein VG538_14140 [Vicinamibacterales bacterium]|nr:hypothetical protein [Vicinamibacterales bacterium]